VIAVLGRHFLGIEKFQHIFPVNPALYLPFSKEKTGKNLSGFGDVVALSEFDHFSILAQKFIKGVEECAGNLVSD